MTFPSSDGGVSNIISGRYRAPIISRRFYVFFRRFSDERGSIIMIMSVTIIIIIMG